jgi:hypothetical protein
MLCVHTSVLVKLVPVTYVPESGLPPGIHSKLDVMLQFYWRQKICGRQGAQIKPCQICSCGAPEDVTKRIRQFGASRPVVPSLRGRPLPVPCVTGRSAYSIASEHHRFINFTDLYLRNDELINTFKKNRMQQVEAAECESQASHGTESWQELWINLQTDESCLCHLCTWI